MPPIHATQQRRTRDIRRKYPASVTHPRLETSSSRPISGSGYSRKPHRRSDWDNECPIMIAHLVNPATRHIPDDVLWYIFGFVLFNDKERGPTTVSQVSRQWRHVAINSSSLWTCISVRLVLSGQKHLEALNHLTRSRDQPLELCIRASRGWREGEVDLLVRPYADRIKRLDVTTWGGSRDLIWMGFCGIEFRMLEAFDGVAGPDSGIWVKRNPMLVLEGSTPIGMEVDGDDGDEGTPWSGMVPPVYDIDMADWYFWRPIALTSFKLVTIGLSRPPSLLALAQAVSASSATLVEFEFEGWSPRPKGRRDRNRLLLLVPIVLPALRSLRVAYHDDLTGLLSLFEIPNLESLTLRNFIDCPVYSLGKEPPPSPELMNGAELMDILLQWTTIKHLGLYAIQSLPTQKVSEYVETLNRLESLVLYGQGGPHEFVHVLGLTYDSRSAVLPKLKHLTATWCSSCSCDAAVFTFLDTRRTRVCLDPLETLTLDETAFELSRGDLPYLPLEELGMYARQVFFIDNPGTSTRFSVLDERLKVQNGTLWKAKKRRHPKAFV